MDSFGYSHKVWSAYAGTYLRQSKILRPYAEIGVGFGTEKISARFADSSLKFMAPSEVRSFWLQPGIGAEINPYETWYFRLSFTAPMRLLYSIRQPELANRFGLRNNGHLEFQKYDLRYGVEVGRSLLRRRLELHGALRLGSRYLFDVHTPDQSKAFTISAGIRYHFGSF